MAKPAVVTGERAVEEAISHGFYPVVDHGFDTFAIPGVGGEAKPGICTCTVCLFSCLSR